MDDSIFFESLDERRLAISSKYRIPIVPPNHGHGRPWGGIIDDTLGIFPEELRMNAEDELVKRKLFWFKYLYNIKKQLEKSDVVIVGIPTDIDVEYRHGARFGPRAIRDASFQFSPYTEYNCDLSSFRICDIGDVEVHPYVLDEDMWKEDDIYRIQYHQYLQDKEIPPKWTGNIQRIEWTLKWMLGYKIPQMNTILPNMSPTYGSKNPIPVIIGGGHGISFPCIKAVFDSLDDNERDNFFVIYFDAHPDLLKRRSGLEKTHASQATRVAEHLYNNLESHPDGRIIQIGVRDIEEEERETRKEYKIKWLKMGGLDKDYEADEICRYRDVNNSFNKIREWLRLSNDKGNIYLYISVDIDVLDAGLIPGTGTPDIGGLSGRELIDLLHQVVSEKEIKLYGLDVVETAPDRNIGNISGVTSVRVIWETIGTYLKTHNRSGGYVRK